MITSLDIVLITSCVCRAARYGDDYMDDLQTNKEWLAFHISTKTLFNELMSAKGSKQIVAFLLYLPIFVLIIASHRLYRCIGHQVRHRRDSMHGLPASYYGPRRYVWGIFLVFIPELQQKIR